MNTLAEDVEIKGSITFAQPLSIEGRVEGDVTSSGDLTVGPKAFIRGNIKTRSVVISGVIEGNVTAQQRCEAKASASIFGDITAAAFKAEAGATFVGRSRIGKAPGNFKLT